MQYTSLASICRAEGKMNLGMKVATALQPALLLPSILAGKPHLDWLAARGQKNRLGALTRDGFPAGVRPAAEILSFASPK